MNRPTSSARPRVVLFLHRLQTAAPTGVHRYAVELAAALAALQPELDLELFSGRSGSPDPTDFPMRLSHPAFPRRPLQLAWMTTGRPRAERVAGPMDLFHPLLPFAPVRTKAPQVLTINDLIALHHPQWHPGLVGDAVRRTIRVHSKTVAAIIVPSQIVADDLQETVGIDRERITVTPYAAGGSFAANVGPTALSDARNRHGIADRPYLIAVGAISERKNLEVLFAALAALSARGTDPPLLVMAGPDDVGAGEVRESAKRHGVAHLVCFTGWISADDLRALMSGATALVHPSWYEGFGFTPLEAMVAGIPVVASTRGSVPEVVGDAALLAEPDDPEEWATAIERMLAEPSMRADLIARGRARAAEFTWENTARLTLDVYRKVLE